MNQYQTNVINNVFPSLCLYIVILSYLFGSIPFGIIWSKFFSSINILQQGSGNIGATNVTRIIGKLPGILTLISDIAKSFIALHAANYLIYYFTNHSNGNNVIFDQSTRCFLMAIAKMAVSIGATYSVWISFYGGRGISAMFGILLYDSIFFCFFCTIVWISTFLYKKIASLASMVVVAVALCFGIASSRYEYFFICALVIWRHKDNITLLQQGKELHF